MFEASRLLEEALGEGRHEEIPNLIPALEAATKAAIEAAAALKQKDRIAAGKIEVG